MGRRPTVRAALAEAVSRLAAAGVASPGFDAELLLRTAAGWSAAELVARQGEPLPDECAAVFEEWIRERASRRPLQHLTGSVEFFGLSLAVGPEALIPRPDTETLVEAALARLGRHTRTPLRIADVGCGSGAVALALAAHLRAARVFALDISEAALALTKKNAQTTELGERVIPAASDLLSAVQSNSLDAVVANLPYIPDDDLAVLEPEVRDHEPQLALAGGPDGLDPLRRIAPMAVQVLREGGHLLVEIGAGQSDASSNILECAGFDAPETSHDLAGVPRVLAARNRTARGGSELRR